jgi:hypothetical protein
MRFSNFEGPFPVRLFPRGLVYVPWMYWEQGTTSGPLTWPFISFMTKRRDDTHMLFDSRSAVALSFFFLPNLLPCSGCVAKLSRVIRAKKWQCSSPTSIPNEASFCPFFFSLHMIAYQKQKGLSRPFFPFSSCKLQKHGRMSSFCNC